jgi:hypothetical protein
LLEATSDPICEAVEERELKCTASTVIMKKRYRKLVLLYTV